MCIQTRVWPQRLRDVQELDKIILEKVAHGGFEVIKELRISAQRKGEI